MRYAIVKNARTRREVGAYLPENYTVIGEVPFKTSAEEYLAEGIKPPLDPRPAFIIAGEDVAGWTLDGYVTGRCASGLLWVDEVTIGHPALEALGLPDDGYPADNPLSRLDALIARQDAGEDVAAEIQLLRNGVPTTKSDEGEQGHGH